MISEIENYSKLNSLGADRREYSINVLDFPDFCFYIGSHYPYLWLTDIIAQEEREGETLSLTYSFLELETSSCFSIKISISINSELYSVGAYWKNAQALEREIFEFFGVEFNRKYTKNIFKNYDFKKEAPLRKKFTSNDLVRKIQNDEISKKEDCNIELRDILQRKQVHFSITEKHNLVLDCEIKAGLSHIGLEKILEDESLDTIYTNLESYFPLKAVCFSTLLSRVIENQAKIDIPIRAQGIRMILLELNRITNHLITISQVAYQVRHNQLYQKSLTWISHVQALFLSYSGNEFGRNLIRPGGITHDVDQTWFSRIIEELIKLEKSVFIEYQQITKSRTWKETLNTILVSKKDCADWSLTGPIIRSVGINYDKRKTDPFYLYKDVDFETPLGSHGKCYDLLLVYFEEIFQSVKIIIQVVDNMPAGNIMAKNLDQLYLYNSKENLDEAKYIDLVKKQFNESTVRSQLALETHNGQLSLLIDYDKKVNRLRLYSEDIIRKKYFEKMIQNKSVDDVLIAWSCLSISMKEVER